MKTFCILITVLCLTLGFQIVQAGSISLEDFYAIQIDKKIAQREVQVKLMASNESRNLLCDGKSAADQVKFLKQNKDALIRQMAEEQVGENPSKVEYFLIKAYFGHVTHKLLYACKGAM